MKKSFLIGLIAEYHQEKSLGSGIFNLSTEGIQRLENFVNQELKDIDPDVEITANNLKELCHILESQIDRIYLTPSTDKVFAAIHKELDYMAARYVNGKKNDSYSNFKVFYTPTDEEYPHVIKVVEAYNNAKREAFTLSHPKEATLANQGETNLSHLGRQYFYGEEDKVAEDRFGDYISTPRFRQDVKKGLAFLEAASEFDQKACLTLSYEYAREINDHKKVIEPNQENAIKFFEKAASCGSYYAKKTLDEYQKLRQKARTGDQAAKEIIASRGGEETTLIWMIRNQFSTH